MGRLLESCVDELDKYEFRPDEEQQGQGQLSTKASIILKLSPYNLFVPAEQAAQSTWAGYRGGEAAW